MRMLTMATDDPRGFEVMCGELESMFLAKRAVARGEWQSQANVPAHMATRDLNHVVLEMPIPADQKAAAEMTGANLPWAEDHFQERVGGEPLNPPPSSEWWPYKTASHAGHVNEAKEFSHTYPERMWPRFADGHGREGGYNRGIKFEYGDLQDLVRIFDRNIWTRQGYLPIWFPEDLTASVEGQRVPCTLGYHFLATNDGMDCTYMIRSCDYMRHFRDDVYMAMRLTQWLCSQICSLPTPNRLYMHIMNFHIFQGDTEVLRSRNAARVEVLGGEA